VNIAIAIRIGPKQAMWWFSTMADFVIIAGSDGKRKRS